MSETENGFDPTKPAWTRDGRIALLRRWKDHYVGSVSSGEAWQWNMDGTSRAKGFSEYDLVNVAPPVTDATAAVAPFVFTYRNYRGEVAERRVQPISVRFGTTEWHPQPGWLLRGFDLEKMAEREFAMADIGASPEAVLRTSSTDYADLAKMEHEAEEAECARMALDDHGVPRASAVAEYSLVGRIMQLEEFREPRDA